MWCWYLRYPSASHWDVLKIIGHRFIYMVNYEMIQGGANACGARWWLQPSLFYRGLKWSSSKTESSMVGFLSGLSCQEVEVCRRDRLCIQWVVRLTRAPKPTHLKRWGEKTYADNTKTLVIHFHFITFCAFTFNYKLKGKPTFLFPSARPDNSTASSKIIKDNPDCPCKSPFTTLLI